MGDLSNRAQEIAAFLDMYVNLPKQPQVLSETQLITEVLNGTIDGVIACKLKPKNETIREKWSAFPPIYKRIDVQPHMLGTYSVGINTKWNLMTKAANLLVNVTETKGVQLFDTRFCRWLANEEGYTIYNVKYVTQWKCIAIFEAMIQKIVDLRRFGDTEEVLRCISEIAKLLLNAAYGKMVSPFLMT